MHLFGEVKFLHLLALLMVVDVVTGLVKAFKNRNLWSRKSLFGFARKILVFGVIILANVIDQVLGMNGAVTYATVVFYIASEGLSIVENMSEIGVLIPSSISERLHVIKNEQNSESGFSKEVKEEFSTKNEKRDEE
ncbi:phage holin family protein [Salipaludibacillus sp. CF4.18]|uniref:phage holin family protein n=1 Tax=Salipaludibacillus sp. CF4.18 TaxID=3373081 RepID=UPI003EE7FF22